MKPEMLIVNLKREKCMKIIDLEGAVNARDLGGMPTKNGGIIRPRRLIRSDALDKLTENDIKVLREDHGLAAVIDLRTGTEVGEKPDVPMDGVEYVHIPIFTEETIGISRGKKTEASMKENKMPAMTELYRHMIADEKAVANYKKVIGRIMAAEEGAILWHCTAGKDRCGMTSILVEYILGVDMERIFEDYMYTNVAAVPIAEKYCAYILAQTGNEAQAQAVYRAFVADMDYLKAALEEMDRLYGGIDGFVEKGLGIGAAAIEAFRKKSLV